MTSANDTTLNQPMSRRTPWGKLFTGDYGLAKTFWIHTVLLSLIFKILVVVVALYSNSRTATLALVPPYYIYRITALSGAWNAASKYNGKLVWSALTKVVVLFGALYVFSELTDLYQKLFYPV